MSPCQDCQAIESHLNSLMFTFEVVIEIEMHGRHAVVAFHRYTSVKGFFSIISRKINTLLGNETAPLHTMTWQYEGLEQIDDHDASRLKLCLSAIEY